MTQLLVATHNQGKIREDQHLLADLHLEVTSLEKENITHDVDETGTTFVENAILKAQQYAAMSGLLTWADDSGLEIDALDGRPGVYSARYGVKCLTDKERYELVLRELQEGGTSAPWTARFRCVVALALPNGEIHTVEDTVEGEITTQPRGDHGFGYDPVFFVPELNATIAELPKEVKNQISHRGKAAVKARKLLEELLR